jgi:hyperosmotically inducible periplasmic protein
MSMRTEKRILLAIQVGMLVGYAFLTAPGLANSTSIRQNVSPKPVAEEIRHELVMLPFYNVFDNLEFRMADSGEVILSGQVTRPTLRSDAQRVVERLSGVTRVVNEIEVLPLSPMDDRIRLATYRAIYSRPGLDRYALRAVPTIHLIVKNGNVTLAGVVSTKADKNLAEITANGVFGVFRVTNDLRTER